MILDTPNPEAYLVDLQQGIQIFELRAYAAEMGHRLPARHEIHQNILRSFAENNIILPFPPFEARVDMVGNILRSGTKICRAVTRCGNPADCDITDSDPLRRDVNRCRVLLR